MDITTYLQLMGENPYGNSVGGGVGWEGPGWVGGEEEGTSDNAPFTTHNKDIQDYLKQQAAALGTAPPKFVTRQLSAGMQGDDVSEYQGMLGIPQTGVFDAATVAATKAFQKANGLQVDGVAGKDTFKALLGASAAPINVEPAPGPAPTPHPAPAPFVAPPPIVPKKKFPMVPVLAACAVGAFIFRKPLGKLF